MLLSALAAIPINGIWVPFQGVEKSMRRFAVPAFLRAEGQAADIALFGSAFVFRYRERNFALCTRHQFGKGELERTGEDFTLTFRDADGQLHGVNPNRVTKLTFNEPEHANFGDLFLAEFDDRRSQFDVSAQCLRIDFDRILEKCPPDRVKLVFAFGYPIDEAAYDFVYDEDDVPVAADIVVRWMKIYLRPDGPRLLDTENRMPMIPDPRDPKEPADPNGFSGGPVFFIAMGGDDRPYVGFAGIVTDARPGRYMVYRASAIGQIVDRYIDLP